MRIGLAGAGRIGALHAATLSELPDIDGLVVADTDGRRARDLADRLGVKSADSVDALFGERLDGLVVAAATGAHAELVVRGASAGLPVFCEKPLAADIPGTVQVVEAVRASGVPVQIGFQRRFDPGHIAVRQAIRSGRLGWIHTIRSCTLDPAPPPRDYLPVSGGIFRDCAVHDLDAIRFVTGREVVQVIATGANQGDEIFRRCDDVDTAAAVLTLDNGTLVTISATRYNAAGYDVRLEALGSADSVVAGLDGRSPLTRVGEPGPSRPHTGFLERFADAYHAELLAFTEVVAGKSGSSCPPEESLEAFYVAEACQISQRENRAVRVDEVRRTARPRA